MSRFIDTEHLQNKIRFRFGFRFRFRFKKIGARIDNKLMAKLESGPDNYSE